MSSFDSILKFRYLLPSIALIFVIYFYIISEGLIYRHTVILIGNSY